MREWKRAIEQASLKSVDTSKRVCEYQITRQLKQRRTQVDSKQPILTVDPAVHDVSI